MRNKYVKQAHISEDKFCRILKCFCLDITAADTAEHVHVSRKTVNRFFNRIREFIAPLSGAAGDFEVDESYFGAKRVRGMCWLVLLSSLMAGRLMMDLSIMGMIITGVSTQKMNLLEASLMVIASNPSSFLPNVASESLTAWPTTSSSFISKNVSSGLIIDNKIAILN